MYPFKSIIRQIITKRPYFPGIDTFITLGLFTGLFSIVSYHKKKMINQSFQS